MSDRIEKEPLTSPIVQALEQGARRVVRGDWRNNISEELRGGQRRNTPVLGIALLALINRVLMVHQ